MSSTKQERQNHIFLRLIGKMDEKVVKEELELYQEKLDWINVCCFELNIYFSLSFCFIIE